MPIAHIHCFSGNLSTDSQMISIAHSIARSDTFCARPQLGLLTAPKVGVSLYQLWNIHRAFNVIGLLTFSLVPACLSPENMHYLESLNHRSPMIGR
jgi:hypothetical protein